tara:strand:+ start:226414 stop:226674 length:261 start_codon:yes stop_codon:yes gene_type:complete
MEDNKKQKFIFNRSNYMYLIVGVVLNVIGFLMMIGGGAESPNDFNGEELFSSMRITISPIVILLGYAVIIYSIMKKPSPSEQESDD